MYDARTHRIENRIVSLSQYWVRPIVRGKQNAEVQFGSKVEMSVVDGYLQVEEIRWNAFNERTTLIQSVEAYRRSYGQYPKRVLADTIFRTRDNLRFCKEHGIHMNGPRLGRLREDESVYRQERRQEWLESGERGEIERDSNWKTPTLARSYHDEAKAYQRGGSMRLCAHHEPLAEAPASFLHNLEYMD